MELKEVQGIGPKTLERLNANQIYTVNDLLLTFPKKYTFYNVDNENIIAKANKIFLYVSGKTSRM